jgi:hypothetical protein
MPRLREPEFEDGLGGTLHWSLLSRPCSALLKFLHRRKPKYTVNPLRFQSRLLELGIACAMYCSTETEPELDSIAQVQVEICTLLTSTGSPHMCTKETHKSAELKSRLALLLSIRLAPERSSDCDCDV